MNNYEQPSYQSNPNAITIGNSFLSKVFFFFGLAIATSAAGAYVGVTYFSSYFLAHPALMWVCFAVELVLLVSAKIWNKTKPLNYLLFLLFALITGVTIVPLLSLIMVMGGVGIIIKALIATTLMFTAAAIFGATTNLNLSGLRGFLFLSVIGMIIVSVIGIFIPWGNTFEMIFSGFGVVLFSGYAMYDVQRLKSFKEDEYIDAALELYLDIFNLFVYLLRLISAFNRD